MREIYIAIAQFHPRLNEPQKNLERMGDIIDHIGAAQKVDLIVFPELATTGYECGVKFAEFAEQLLAAADCFLDCLCHSSLFRLSRFRTTSVDQLSALDGARLSTFTRAWLRSVRMTR